MAKKLVLPKENLFRACYSVPASATTNVRALRADPGEDGDGRTLEVQWYVANRWTEIDSFFEGRFMERIAPGAASKTIRENRANMRILLQHGRDPQLGDKPIAPIDVLEENEIGGYAEGRLFDGLDPLVVEGLRAGVYGASFRFRVLREEINEEPDESEDNPNGLPERTIKEMGVQEFGPVTWGAYDQASAGVRSITDEMYFGAMRGMPAERLKEVAAFWRTLDTTFTETDAPSDEAADPPVDESREQDSTPDEPPTKGTRKVKDYLHGGLTKPAWFLP
jgi:phage head maturation protease